MKIHHLKRRPLYKSNTSDQNFMKLGHSVKYHNIFFKFDNGPYPTMLSAVIALCLWKFTVLNDVRPLSWIVLIRILWNFITLFSTIMSSSNLIIVYMAPCFLGVIALSLWKIIAWNNVCSFTWIVLILGHIIKYHNVFKFQNGPYRNMPSGVIALC